MEEVQTTPSREQIVELMKSIIDPELFIDIWALGLIYHIQVKDEGKVYIRMTFTSMACPAGPQLVTEVKEKIKTLPEVTDVEVEVVFDPPWEPSEELKAMMGIF